MTSCIRLTLSRGIFHVQSPDLQYLPTSRCSLINAELIMNDKRSVYTEQTNKVFCKCMTFPNYGCLLCMGRLSDKLFFSFISFFCTIVHLWGIGVSVFEPG